LVAETVKVLSPETLERYRRMTTPERLKLALRLMEEGIRCLNQGDPEVVKRRLELLRRENDERNRNMLTAIARTRKQP
jgi:hypothetical protein